MTPARPHSGDTAQHSNYARVYLSLVALLVASVLGPLFGIPWLTLATAFGIALVKAALVVQNFMHLRWERRLIGWMLAWSVVLILLLFAGVAPDVMRHDGTNWENTAAKEAIERGIPMAEEES
jgi:caa(3)-type oxidase subunit IV